MKRVWAASTMVAAASFAVLWQGRSYPWQLALLAALAIGALVYATWRTVHNLRTLAAPYRRSAAAPGEADDRSEEQQMGPAAGGQPGQKQGHPG